MSRKAKVSEERGPGLNLAAEGLTQSTCSMNGGSLDQGATSIFHDSDGKEDSHKDLDANEFQSGSWCHSAPMTNVGKRQQQVKMVLLILIPFATLLSVALYMNTDSIFAMIQADQTKSTVEFSVFVGRLIVVLQKEQDQSVLYLSSIGPETKFFLAQTYMETDLYLEELPYWPVGLDRSDRRFFDSKIAFQNYLQRHRKELGHSNISIYDEILFYKNSIDVFLIWLYDALKESRYSSLWKTLVAYQKVIFCVHYAGIERALGTTYFVEGGFSDPYLYIKYNEVVYVFKNNFEAAMKYSPLVKPISEYNALVNGENLTTIIERYRDQIQFQNISAPSLNDAAAWFDFMSTYLDILFNFQTELAEDILQILNERSQRVLTDVASSSLVICIVIIILPVTLRAIYNLTNDIQSYAISLAHKTRELNMEKRRTESLLHQMLPKPVAERLKRKKGSLAEYFKDVTIYFSDIPGFTRMSSELAPMEIVQILNHLYTIFDSRIEKYDVYKVETIGDSYMVASGLPRPNENRHAVEIASMALDLMDTAHKLHFSDLQVPVAKINLRIGIHSGPVVAGVVGMKLPRYCLFGDTVNTASRMESHGQANKIHVSLATWKLLVRHSKGFLLTSRGKIDLKGKGKTHSFWLEGKDGFQIAGTSGDDKQEATPNVFSDSASIKVCLDGPEAPPNLDSDSASIKVCLDAGPVSSDWPGEESRVSLGGSVSISSIDEASQPTPEASANSSGLCQPTTGNDATEDGTNSLQTPDEMTVGSEQGEAENENGGSEQDAMEINQVNLSSEDQTNVTDRYEINIPTTDIEQEAFRDIHFTMAGFSEHNEKNMRNVKLGQDDATSSSDVDARNHPPTYMDLMEEIQNQEDLV